MEEKVVSYRLICGNNRIYTFTVIGESFNGRYGKTLVGKCRETGETAYLDDNGVRFRGCDRIIASIIPNPSQQNQIPYGYGIWGGQLRDRLPHGRRYYMNGRRWPK